MVKFLSFLDDLYSRKLHIAGRDDVDHTNRAALVQAIIDDLALLAKGSSGSKQNRLTVRGMGSYLVCVS